MSGRKPPRGRPRPKGFDDVPILSDEEVERRVDVRGGAAPHGPVERAPRVVRPPRRKERTVARDSLLLIGLVIVGLVAVRVLLPDGPLSPAASNSPSGTQAVVASVPPASATSSQAPTLVPVITLPPGSALPTAIVEPTAEPTTPAPTSTPRPGTTPKPTPKVTPKPTPVPTPVPTAPNRATLIVIMDVINNSGGSTPASAWTMVLSRDAAGGASKNNFAGSESGTTLTIPAGQGYLVQDDASQAGYAPRLSSADCSRPNGVGLAAGAVVTCTITRNDRPRVRVVTHVVNDNVGTASAADWGVSVTSANATPSSFAGSESGTVVVLGFDLSYSISISGPAEYAESTTGDCSSTLGLGVDAPATLCTFTLDDPAPGPTGFIPWVVLPLLRPRRWRTTATG